jgi:hypothetical protein
MKILRLIGIVVATLLVVLAAGNMLSLVLAKVGLGTTLVLYSGAYVGAAAGVYAVSIVIVLVATAALLALIRTRIPR